MKKKGFTLIEMIMAMVIVGIISAIMAMVVSGGMNAWFFMRTQKGMMQEASTALRRLAREIRMTNTITTAVSNEYDFIDTKNSSIEYLMSGTTLLRNNKVLLDNLAVSGSNFSYFNASGETTAALGKIKIVQINVILQSGSNRVRLQSAAGIRNK